MESMAAVLPEDAAQRTTGEAPSTPGSHREDGGLSHSDAESLSASATLVAGYKRKKRRPAVTEEEDVAILRAIAQIAPYRAPRQAVKHRWQQVVESVAAETGTGMEITRSLCQRRYEILLNRFLARRQLQKEWPLNPELRALLEEAVEERKTREEAGKGRTTQLQPALTLDALRAALAAASTSGDGRASLAPLDESVEPKREPKREADGIDAAMSPATMTLEDVQKLLARLDPASAPTASAQECESLTERRAFVKTTLIAVLDRIGDIEKTWFASARKERELQRQHLEIGKHNNSQTSSIADGRSQSESTVKPSDSSKETGAAVESGEENHTDKSLTVEEIEALKSQVATLAGFVSASQETHRQLSKQVVMLSAELSNVQQDKDVLRQEVTMLQALLRDAASLAGTLKTLRDSHRQHEQTFEAYVQEQDSRIAELQRQLKECRPVTQGNDALETGEAQALLASIQRQRRAEHDARLAELDARLELVHAPITALQATANKQHEQIQQHAKTLASRSETELALNEIKTAITAERTHRLTEYGALLETIEQVAAGKAKLI
jgi:chromosome segregation ATPase